VLTCNVGPSRSPTTLTSALAESSTTSGGNSSDHRTFSSSEKSAITIYFLTTSQFNPATGVRLLYCESQSISVLKKSNKKVLLKLCKTMAGQTLLHGCKKRTSIKHHGRRTEVVELKFLRSIIGYTL